MHAILIAVLLFATAMPYLSGMIAEHKAAHRVERQQSTPRYQRRDDNWSLLQRRFPVGFK
jgi:hypothetical protein